MLCSFNKLVGEQFDRTIRRSLCVRNKAVFLLFPSYDKLQYEYTVQTLTCCTALLDFLLSHMAAQLLKWCIQCLGCSFIHPAGLTGFLTPDGGGDTDKAPYFA